MTLLSDFCLCCHVTQGNRESSQCAEGHRRDRWRVVRLEKAGEGVSEMSDCVVPGCQNRSVMAWEGRD